MATKTNAAKAKTGQPRWTYVLGALVATGTLVWAITSHFIPKAEPTPRPTPTATPPAAPTTTVTVTGSGSVGVGTMSGGEIKVGAPPPTPAADRSTAQKNATQK